MYCSMQDAPAPAAPAARADVICEEDEETDTKESKTTATVTPESATPETVKPQSGTPSTQQTAVIEPVGDLFCQTELMITWMVVKYPRITRITSLTNDCSTFLSK